MNQALMQTHGELTNREMINVKKWKFKHLCTAAPCTVYPVCILANPILTYLFQLLHYWRLMTHEKLWPE